MPWLLLLSPAFLPGPARSRHIVACLPDRTAASAADPWEAMFGRLVEYEGEWGSADAVLGTELGRWCTTQRRLRATGALAAGKAQRLEELGLSWESPTDILPTESDWADMCRRLATYRAETGDAQVPKKLKTDPELGGWVAAVRRQGPEVLSVEERAAAEAAGFEWVSTRKCGSSFMKEYRSLVDFHEEHGHCAVERLRETDDDLVRWSEAQRGARRKGMLVEERVDYLNAIGFEWQGADATAGGSGGSGGGGVVSWYDAGKRLGN